MGQILTAGQGQNPARQASVAAGVPVETILLPDLIHASLHLDGVAPAACAILMHAGRALRQASANPFKELR